MKKHIRKRFLFEVEFTPKEMGELESTGGTIPWEEVTKIKKFPKDVTGWMITDTNKMIQTFPYTHQGQTRFIPEPDPVLVYFHAAYLNYRLIEGKKKQILNILVNDQLTEAIINDLYEFFGLTSGFVIFLFTAIEAHINRCIPKDFTYTKADKRKTEVYSRKQIEEYLPFDEKIKTVLTQATSKSFEKQYPLKYQHLQNLKEFRDSIVHTKASHEGHTPYDYLYKRALKFDYKSTINAVKDFCNFYHKPDYIEECHCNLDF